MRKIALISAILEHPAQSQKQFNEIISAYKSIIKGRMGLPFDDDDLAVIAITVIGSVNEINSLTGKLGKIQNVVVSTAFSKKELSEKE